MLRHTRFTAWRIICEPASALITWEFPRLCRGGSRSLTYAAVVVREACDGLKIRRDACGAGRLAIKVEAGDAVQQTQSDAFIRDGLRWTSLRQRGDLGKYSAFR